jgi:hypothetical protein
VVKPKFQVKLHLRRDLVTGKQHGLRVAKCLPISRDESHVKSLLPLIPLYISAFIVAIFGCL